MNIIFLDKYKQHKQKMTLDPTSIGICIVVLVCIVLAAVAFARNRRKIQRTVVKPDNNQSRFATVVSV